MKYLVDKIFTNRILFNILSVILINIILFLFWILFRNNNNLTITFVTLFQMIYNLFINTIYLIIINIKHSIKYKNNIFILNILLLALSCFIGILLHYFSWGVSTGNLLNPDWGTVYLFSLMLLVIPIIFFIGIIEQVIIYLLKKVENK